MERYTYPKDGICEFLTGEFIRSQSCASVDMVVGITGGAMNIRTLTADGDAVQYELEAPLFASDGVFRVYVRDDDDDDDAVFEGSLPECADYIVGESGVAGDWLSCHYVYFIEPRLVSWWTACESVAHVRLWGDEVILYGVDGSVCRVRATMRGDEITARVYRSVREFVFAMSKCVHPSKVPCKEIFVTHTLRPVAVVGGELVSMWKNAIGDAMVGRR